MKLPKAPPEYDQTDQTRVRAELERSDARVLKTGRDVELINGERLFVGFAANITAHAGGGKPSATVLTAQINHVSVVASAADSILLPPALAGLRVTVINRGASACQVFGQGTDTINGTATGTGVSQASGTKVTYECPIATQWFY